MGWNLLLLCALIFFFASFSYMQQKRQLRHTAQRERLRKKREALLQTLQGKTSEPQDPHNDKPDQSATESE